MKRFTHITYNPEILDGKPYIRGTRLSVEFILELFASGAAKGEIIETYPQLIPKAIEEALVYAAKSLKNEVLLPGKTKSDKWRKVCYQISRKKKR